MNSHQDSQDIYQDCEVTQDCYCISTLSLLLYITFGWHKRRAFQSVAVQAVDWHDDSVLCSFLSAVLCSILGAVFCIFLAAVLCIFLGAVLCSV